MIQMKYEETYVTKQTIVILQQIQQTTTTQRYTNERVCVAVAIRRWKLIIYMYIVRSKTALKL